MSGFFVMPLLHVCAYAGCSCSTPIGQKYCARHEAKGRALEEKRQAERAERLKQRSREFDRERPSPTERGYGTAWRKAREGFLRHHPLCAECDRQGRLSPATVVDHIVPHKGDRSLFWDHDNWQPLCKQCHDRKTATEDSRFVRRR